MIRTLGRALGGLAFVLGLLIVAGLGWRAWLQHQTAEAVAVRSPTGIDEARFVRIGGIDQWITIRGEDRRDPVVLVLHGGPGSPFSYLLRQFQPMEQHYVVVQWDQRGGGKTLGRAGGQPDPNIHMTAMVSDGIELSEYLRRYLHRDKIVVVGQSWGSILGVKMVQARPDLYAAFVGTGQAACSRAVWQRWSYSRLQAEVKAAGDVKGLAELTNDAGPPPWADGSSQMMHMAHAAGPYLPPHLSYDDNARAVLTAPHWRLADVLALQRGIGGVMQSALGREVRDLDFSRFGGVFAVPVVVIQGENDETTPTEYARDWFARVQAPAKTFVVIPGQGHSVLLTGNAAFTRALDANLRPLLGTAPSAAHR